MKNKIKTISKIVLFIAITVYAVTGISFADTSPIDLNSLEDMPSISNTENNVTTNNNTVNNTVINNTTTQNTATQNSTNTTSVNASKIPQTGSNTEVIFGVGITVLVATSIVIYKKTKII